MKSLIQLIKESEQSNSDNDYWNNKKTNMPLYFRNFPKLEIKKRDRKYGVSYAYRNPKYKNIIINISRDRDYPEDTNYSIDIWIYGEGMRYYENIMRKLGFSNTRISGSVHSSKPENSSYSFFIYMKTEDEAKKTLNNLIKIDKFF